MLLTCREREFREKGWNKYFTILQKSMLKAAMKLRLEQRFTFDLWFCVCASPLTFDPVYVPHLWLCVCASPLTFDCVYVPHLRPLIVCMCLTFDVHGNETRRVGDLSPEGDPLSEHDITLQLPGRPIRVITERGFLPESKRQKADTKLEKGR